MLYLFLYTFIALCFALLIIWHEANGISRHINEKEDGAMFIVLICIWPVTMLLILSMLVWESYKRRVDDKLQQVLVNIRRDHSAVRTLNARTLKNILYAERIGASHLNDELKRKVQQQLIDISFENHLLENKDER